MADGALLAIDALALAAALDRGQSAGPHHLIGIHIQNLVDRIDGWTAPLGTAVKAGEDDGLLVHREGDELAVAAKFAEGLHRPGVCLRRARGQHVHGQALAGKRRGKIGQRLRFGRHFAGNGAGRIGALGNGIERVAGESVKLVKPALFGGLGNGLDGLAAAPHRE